MELQIIQTNLLDRFKTAGIKNFSDQRNNPQKLEIPVDYFRFYTSVSSVCSSKIEGGVIDFDSYFRLKFLNVKFKPNYTKKADDLYKAYEFIFKNPLNIQNLKKAHAILSANLLPKSLQGHIRTNPMFVINEQDRIKYVATAPGVVAADLNTLFKDLQFLLETDIDETSVFYFASHLHLSFVKIHLFHDANSRTAKLLEKWFLKEKFGERAISIHLERNYYRNLKTDFSNIRKIGPEYLNLN